MRLLPPDFDAFRFVDEAEPAGVRSLCLQSCVRNWPQDSKKALFALLFNCPRQELARLVVVMSRPFAVARERTDTADVLTVLAQLPAQAWAPMLDDMERIVEVSAQADTHFGVTQDAQGRPAVHGGGEVYTALELASHDLEYLHAYAEMVSAMQALPHDELAGADPAMGQRLLGCGSARELSERLQGMVRLWIAGGQRADLFRQCYNIFTDPELDDAAGLARLVRQLSFARPCVVGLPEEWQVGRLHFAGTQRSVIRLVEKLHGASRRSARACALLRGDSSEAALRAIEARFDHFSQDPCFWEGQGKMLAEHPELVEYLAQLPAPILARLSRIARSLFRLDKATVLELLRSCVPAAVDDYARRIEGVTTYDGLYLLAAAEVKASGAEPVRVSGVEVAQALREAGQNETAPAARFAAWRTLMGSQRSLENCRIFTCERHGDLYWERLPEALQALIWEAGQALAPDMLTLGIQLVQARHESGDRPHTVASLIQEVGAYCDDLHPAAPLARLPSGPRSLSSEPGMIDRWRERLVSRVQALLDAHPIDQVPAYSEVECWWAGQHGIDAAKHIRGHHEDLGLAVPVQLNDVLRLVLHAINTYEAADGDAEHTASKRAIMRVALANNLASTKSQGAQGVTWQCSWAMCERILGALVREVIE